MDSTDMQKDIRRWVETRLGETAMNPQERALRMLEEAIELAQAMGVDDGTAYMLFHKVYDKEPGDIQQELGGAALTLLAASDACGYVLSQCADRELVRILSLPREKFRTRQMENFRDGIGAPPS